MSDRAAAKAAAGQLVAPGDDMRARDSAELFWPSDAGEAHKITDRKFVSTPCVGVGQIGEPFHLGRHIGELVELGRGQPSIGGGNFGRELVCGHARILLLIKFVIKIKN